MANHFQSSEDKYMFDWKKDDVRSTQYMFARENAGDSVKRKRVRRAYRVGTHEPARMNNNSQVISLRPSTEVTIESNPLGLFKAARPFGPNPSFCRSDSTLAKYPPPSPDASGQDGCGLKD